MENDIHIQQASLVCLGVHVDDAVRRFAGRYELYLKTLRKFAAEIALNGIMDIEKAKDMEAEELRKYVHGLKGVTANLSLVAANQILIDIEKTIKHGKTDFAKYEEMRNMLPETAKRILEITGKDQETGSLGDRPSGSEAECRELLDKLSTYLSMGKARESEEVITTLNEKTWENIDDTILKEIGKAVDDYDYYGAIEKIKGV
jgi:HPt (histidine-containing phosphotransfer) domain-containing protein